MCNYNRPKKAFWLFVIKNEGEGGEISYEQCMEQLGKEAYGSSRGGETSSEGWFYRYVALIGMG